MLNPIQTAPHSSKGFLNHPLCYPIKIVISPLIYIATQIKNFFQKFIGYFVELGVFSFGSYDKSWFKQKLIQLYKGDCYSNANPFDEGRLKKAFKIIINMGGIRSNTYSKSDGAKIDSMIIRSRDVKKKIIMMGGKIIKALPVSIKKRKWDKTRKRWITTCTQNDNAPDGKQKYLDIILQDETKNLEKWKKFCDNTLSNVGLEEAEIILENGKKTTGFIIKSWNVKNPIRPKKDQCFVICNSPTESYPMAKRGIFRYVFLGSDVICWDYPGTRESDGSPSEGSYYLSAETMVEKAANEYGYDWKDIWATGFCLGGAVAAHLKMKYHNENINLFTQNTYDTMQHTLQQQPWPVNILAPCGLSALKSNDPKIYRCVDENDFNTISKFKKCKGKRGITIIVNTYPDKTIGNNAYLNLRDAANNVSEKTFHHLFKCDKPNGHRHDVLGERNIWDSVVEEIAFKDCK